MQTPFRKAPAVGALCVTAYGAVGDGETDDTEAIQDCIDAAFEQSKNVLQSQEGVTINNVDIV